MSKHIRPWEHGPRPQTAQPNAGYKNMRGKAPVARCTDQRVVACVKNFRSRLLYAAASGCSPAVGHMVWDHGTAGSNPVTPGRRRKARRVLSGVLLWLRSVRIASSLSLKPQHTGRGTQVPLPMGFSITAVHRVLVPSVRVRFPEPWSGNGIASICQAMAMHGGALRRHSAVRQWHGVALLG